MRNIEIGRGEKRKHETARAIERYRNKLLLVSELTDFTGGLRVENMKP